MPAAPLMQKATAVWLIDNTTLTFRQIAEFCVLHELEVQGIADGDVAQGIKGLDPVSSGQLRREELEKAQADPGYHMQLVAPKDDVPMPKTRKAPRYTPLSRRQSRPDAIAWLLRHHPELSDGQVIRLVGTTKPTIQTIRDRSHWNMSNITPTDPVSLGLCSQIDLDAAVKKAASRHKAAVPDEAAGAKLTPVAPTPPVTPEPQKDDLSARLDDPHAAFSTPPSSQDDAAGEAEQDNIDPAAVFARLNTDGS